MLGTVASVPALPSLGIGEDHALPDPARNRPTGEFEAAKPASRADGGKDPALPGDLTQAVEKALNALLPKAMPAASNARLQIEVDPDTRDFVYKTIDNNTGDVIRQWPTEQILGLFKVMRELAGLTVDSRV